jgi:hypothetical protein
MSFQKFLGGLLIAALFSAEAHGAAAAEPRHSIAISAPSSTTAGGSCCVFVTSFGGGEPSVEVEIGGHRIDAHVVRVGETGYLVCFDVPQGTSGFDVDVTATNSGGSAVATIPIL